MRRKMVCLTIVLSLSAGAALAADITWSDPLPNEPPLLSGPVIEAINWSGPEAVVGEIVFLADGEQQYSNVADVLSNTGNGPFGVDSGFPDLDVMLNSHRWIGGGATRTLTLTNLSPGTQYQIQIYFSDVRGCCAARTYHLEDPQGNASAVFARGDLISIIGDFKADGATQDIIYIVEQGSTDPGISGYVLSISGDQRLAGSPIPDDGASDVSRDALLSWSPGESADTHSVYIGTSFEDVNEASVSETRGVLASERQGDTVYNPGRFAFDQTYYWRVDEVNSAPDFAVFKGDVWSFTSEPFSIPIANITATASSSFGASGPEKTVDGSGLLDDLHSTSAADMWISGGVPATIEYAFDRAYKLHEMWIWNSNQLIEAFVGFGAKDVVIEHSLDGQSWTAVDGVGPLASGPGSEGYAHNNTIDFGGVTAQQVRITVNSVQGIAPQASLSEVRFFYVPTFAARPNPASGATDVAPDTRLSWGRNGREADRHEVYVGADAENLTSVGVVNESGFDTLALDLQLGNDYAWRVDEVNETMDPSLWEGTVWTFTTADAISIDDMETYADAEFFEIWATWVDGFDDPANGALVGNGAAGTPETSIVHNGSNSMPIHYDNSAAPASEATRTFDAPMDWTRHGVKSLSLYFYGDSSNSGGQLYVRIGDIKVDYDGSVVNILRPTWQLLNIDLATVGDVSNVGSLTIGIEGAGAQGVVYIDDIQLQSEVITQETSPDITGPGDAVQGVPNDSDWPAAESPDLAIDDNTGTKYLHFKGETEPTGFQVTPLLGATIVTEISFTTANDVPNRDPVTFELYGSNASIDGPYTLIASGDIIDFAGATDWPRFTKTETAITFANDVAYTHYQVLFPTVRNPGSANSMQIAEVELIGTVTP